MSDKQTDPRLDAAVSALERILHTIDYAMTSPRSFAYFAALNGIEGICREVLPTLRDAPAAPETAWTPKAGDRVTPKQGVNARRAGVIVERGEWLNEDYWYVSFGNEPRYLHASDELERLPDAPAPTDGGTIRVWQGTEDGE